MIFLKIVVFIKSLIFHIYAGSPKSTKEQILERYSICENCVEFNKKKQECYICGCSIGKRKIFLNKLAWADQKCPIGKWKEINSKDNKYEINK